MSANHSTDHPHPDAGGLDLDAYPVEVQASIVAYGAALRTAEGAVVRRAHSDSVGYVGGHLARREEREAALDASLAPGATRPVGAGNRAVAEEPDPYRTCFEKDLDRIKHSSSFRRLAGKTQVVIAASSVDDHYRNRLTHAIEVAQVATAVARLAGLNVALTEAIALGHDCGHGPAGHASEEAFTPYIDGGFDHAPYGAYTVLAPLNLTAEVVDGIAKHSWKLPAPSTPEAEVVSWADRIAYLCHDANDAIRAGIITVDSLPAEVTEVVGRDQSSQVGTFVTAMLEAIDRTGHVGMTEPAIGALDAFRRYNYEHIYLRPASRRQAEKAIRLLRGLVEHFADAPGRIPDVAAGRVGFPTSGSPEAAAAAVRYVNSMTDRYALDLAVEVLGWSTDQLPRGA